MLYLTSSCHSIESFVKAYKHMIKNTTDVVIIAMMQDSLTRMLKELNLDPLQMLDIWDGKRMILNSLPWILREGLLGLDPLPHARSIVRFHIDDALSEYTTKRKEGLYVY